MDDYERGKWLGPYSRINGKNRLPRHTRELRASLIERDGTDCWICHKSMAAGDITVDHLTPVSLQGTSCISNLKLACSKCNSIRSSRVDWSREQLVNRINWTISRQERRKSRRHKRSVVKAWLALERGRGHYTPPTAMSFRVWCETILARYVK